MGRVFTTTVLGLCVAAGVALGVAIPVALTARSGGGAPAASPDQLVAATHSAPAQPPGNQNRRRATPTPTQSAGPSGRGRAHTNVKLPPSDEAAPCNCTASTPGLNTLVNAIRVHTRSVTSIVIAPPGLAVPNRTEISVLFDLNKRITEDYSPTNGNRIKFDYPIGDGKARQTRIDISLAEHGATAVSTAAYRPTVTILPLFNVDVSPLTFELANQCDGTTFGPFGGGENDSEPRIMWTDERGTQQAEFNNAQSFHPRIIQQFARDFANVSVNDNILNSSIVFEEIDPGPLPDGFPIPPFGFHSSPSLLPGPPILPSTSRKVAFSDHSRGDFPDDFCNANFTYTITITLLTFNLL
jgi:hypothetical protein